MWVWMWVYIRPRFRYFVTDESMCGPNSCRLDARASNGARLDIAV
jgi:hypothetical protein